jgi:hypothetical protein
MTTISGSAVTTAMTVSSPMFYDTQPILHPVVTRDLFDVEVVGANGFRLVPRTELAKSLLAMWNHGEVRRSNLLSAAARDWRYGQAVERMDFEFPSRPMLSSGDDPYHTGMGLSADEAAAARDFIEKRRVEKAAEKSQALLNVIRGSATMGELQAAGIGLKIEPAKPKARATKGKRKVRVRG